VSSNPRPLPHADRTRASRGVFYPLKPENPACYSVLTKFDPLGQAGLGRRRQAR